MKGRMDQWPVEHKQEAYASYRRQVSAGGMVSTDMLPSGGGGGRGGNGSEWRNESSVTREEGFGFGFGSGFSFPEYPPAIRESAVPSSMVTPEQKIADGVGLVNIGDRPLFSKQMDRYR